MAALLAAIVLMDWILGANGRAVDRFQEHAIKILRDHKAQRVEIPVSQLFEDSVAVCIFEAGYHAQTEISMPRDLRFVLPALRKKAESSSLESWEIFAISANNTTRLAFSHGGDIQLSSRSGLGDQCIRPSAMLTLRSDPGLDTETVTVDFP